MESVFIELPKREGAIVNLSHVTTIRLQSERVCIYVSGPDWNCEEINFATSEEAEAYYLSVLGKLRRHRMLIED